MSTLVLAHGFNVKDGGKNTIDKLRHFLGGHNVLQADYGYFDLFGVRFFNKHIAKVVAGMTPAGSIGIGHSNGCDILLRACHMGAGFSRLILINPALDNDADFPWNGKLRRIDVLHNVDDTVVTTSRFMLFHPWGDMGRVGYTGRDTRVINHETKRLFNASGHSDVFNHASALSVYFHGEHVRLNDNYSGN